MKDRITGGSITELVGEGSSVERVCYIQIRRLDPEVDKWLLDFVKAYETEDASLVKVPHKYDWEEDVRVVHRALAQEGFYLAHAQFRSENDEDHQTVVFGDLYRDVQD